jgi:hypothetical protein
MEVEVVVEADLAARVISAAQGFRWTVLRLLVLLLAYFGRGSSPFLFVFDFLGFPLASLFISPLFISL